MVVLKLKRYYTVQTSPASQLLQKCLATEANALYLALLILALMLFEGGVSPILIQDSAVLSNGDPRAAVAHDFPGCVNV